MKQCANCTNQTSNYYLCDECSNRPIQPEELGKWKTADLRKLRAALNMNSVKSTREESLLKEIKKLMDPRFAEIEKLYKTKDTESYGKMIVKTVLRRPSFQTLIPEDLVDLEDALMDIWKAGYRQVHIDEAVLNGEL